MYSRRLRWTASPAVVRSTSASPRISEPSEQRARRVGVEGGRAREVVAQRLPVEPRPARCDQLEGVPGLRGGLALGEVPAQHGAERTLGEGKGLAELVEGNRWCGHVRLRSHRIDRCLTTVANSQSPVYLMEANFPTRPLIGLLLRLLSQHYSQDIHAALQEAGFGDFFF